jgi:radical SAM protein with 4Fe4S-binding SPASM domain
MSQATFKRRLEIVDDRHCFPAYVVWELTLRCDQPCAHCGSRAGKAREIELSVEEALDVVEQLAAMDTREVVLIGGEAYLHEGFLDIVRALKAAGVRPTMTTGGRGVTPELAREMKAAGLFGVGVSIDGTEQAHDAIRKAKGSWQSAMAALDHLHGAGLPIGANTNVNRVNLPVLEELYDDLRRKGVKTWQVQITVPLGRAADRPQMLLQPFEIDGLLERVAALKRRAFDDGITVMAANNLGYFGTEEALLRSVHEGGRDHWQGCQAGRRVMGIESDGGVKGCPSLQSASYIGGTVRSARLKTLWDEAPELAFTRERTVDDLWGYCQSCAFAATCLAGCSFTAHALFGRPGNNPYCGYRARQLAKEGKRERLVPTDPATGLPFDHGLFEIVVEDANAPDPTPPDVNAADRLSGLVAITRRPQRR